MMDTEYLQNAELDGDPFIYEGSQVGILLIHGFTATTAEVRLLANRLHQSGYTVHAPLLPGHGTTPQSLNRIRYQDWIEEVDRAFTSIRQKCKVVFVAGESMGALLSLYLAAKHSDVAGVICYSPALIVRNIWAAVILQYFIDYLPKSGASDNLPWKGYKVNPTKASAQLFYLQRYIKRRLPEIHQPVYVFIGKKDDRISPDAGEYILDHINSERKEILFLEESPHCMILAEEYPVIFSRTEDFIKSIINE